MRFLHISDLHIGKRLNETSMLDDQKAILDEILVLSDKAQAVLIAGDIYDKGVPQADAVEVFDRFLTALRKKNKKVFMISGNHDTPERIAFASDILDNDGIYISPAFDGNVKKTTVSDEYGKINIYLLPFVKPPVVRRFFPQSKAETYNDAIKTVIENIDIDESERNILVCHQFVTGATRSDSEEINVGGLDNVDAEIFSKFDYVALGHIHRSQYVGYEKIRYCGTPLKYSFSEANDQKSVLMIMLNEKGTLKSEKLMLHPIHDMREIKGTYDKLMSKSSYTDSDRNDYLHITLTDNYEQPNAFYYLREVYPNIIRFDIEQKDGKASEYNATINEYKDKTALEIFGDFFKQQNGKELNTEQSEFIADILSDIEGEKK